MKGLLYTPGFSVHLDVLVWVFSSSIVTPLCDDLVHGDVVVYTCTVKNKNFRSSKQCTKRILFGFSVCGFFFLFFFFNATDGFCAGLSLDSKAIILYMSNFLLGIFIEIFLKQNVSSQVI